MLILLAALIAGPVFIVGGIGEYSDSKQLQAHGTATRAEVVKAEEAVTRKGRHKYYLTIQFTPEQGQTLTERCQVPSDRFNGAVADKSISLVYLPSKPKVFQFGEKAETRYGSIVFGSIVLVGALGFIAYLWLAHRSSTRGLTATSPASTPEPAAATNDQQKAA